MVTGAAEPGATGAEARAEPAQAVVFEVLLQLLAWAWVSLPSLTAWSRRSAIAPW